MTKKLKSSFYGSANYLIRNGGTEADVLEKSQEFNITEEEVKVWLRNQIKSKAFGEAMFAGHAEKEALYNILDKKFIDEYPHVVVFERGENQSFYEYSNGVYSVVLENEMYNRVDGLMNTYQLLDYRTSSHRVKDTVRRIGALLGRTPKRHYSDDNLLHRKWYLNLNNGLLDMDKFRLFPHTPEYF